MSAREELKILVSQMTPEQISKVIKYLPLIKEGIKLEGKEFEMFLEVLRLDVKKEFA